MKKLHTTLVKLLKLKVRVPNSTLDSVKEIYFYYKSQPYRSTADIKVVRHAHKLFCMLLEHTSRLQDELEFRRRLCTTGDLNHIESLNQKAAMTTEWLEGKESLFASQAESILHNLYYILKMHSFDAEVKQVFQEIDEYCDWVLRQIEC